MGMMFGIDALQANNFQSLAGKRIGLFTNPSAVNATMQSTYELLFEADPVNLVALFGAEHGAFGIVQDGEHITDSIDPKTGIPVHSLYGETMRPTGAMLADVDAMVCDLQDIGVRYYTYQWTMTYVLEACGEFGVPVIVLDRPNPLGATIAGASLNPDFSSLVGRYDVPIQHGMTIGEMMQMVNARWNPYPADLTVIKCEGYQRHQRWEDTGRPFVPTSPNMPHLSTVKHYPGACLIEGTTLSEGRGTTLPFEIVGAPYIDGRNLAAVLNAHALPDVYFRPHGFTPIARKYAGETCEGVQVHITGDAFDPLLTWLHVIHAIKSHYPDDFGWLPPFTDNTAPIFDKLIGSDAPRKLFDQGACVADVMSGWDTEVAAFMDVRQPYLIYE